MVHLATWLGHRAKGLVGLAFEIQCRHGPGWIFGFPNGYVRIPASAGSKYANLADAVQLSTFVNKPSPGWNEDVKSLYCLITAHGYSYST